MADTGKNMGKEGVLGMDGMKENAAEFQPDLSTQIA